MLTISSARVSFLEEADELGHALETWSDATNQYWVKVGTPSSGKFATFSHEACVR